MKKNLRGELTEARLKQKYSLNNSGMVKAISKGLSVNEEEDMKEVYNSVKPVLVNSVVSTVRAF